MISFLHALFGQIEKIQSEIKPVKRRCPWIVKLRDHKLVKELMYAKHRFTRFNTKDVNFSELDQETVDNISNGKIFINKILSREKFVQYRNLKTVTV